MPNTYTQLYTHVVFAVRGRRGVLSNDWRELLHQYINGIVVNKGQKIMIINSVKDHVHILLGLKAECRLSDIVRDIKSNSSRWINDNKYVKGRFDWQEGFGAFTVGHSQIQTVINYILNQEEHHRKKSFKEEYIEFMVASEIDYKPEYLFDEDSDAPPGL